MAKPIRRGTRTPLQKFFLDPFTAFFVLIIQPWRCKY